MSSASPPKNTRQRLLENAAVLFSAKGYANTSIAEICEAAGANIAAVNYHFRSKEELYREVIRYTYSQAETLFPLENSGQQNDEEMLGHFILTLLQRILSKEMTGNFYHLVTKEMAEPTAESGSLIHEIISGKRKKLQPLIARIYEKPANAELLSRLTHSIVSQCLFLGMHEKGRQHHMKKSPILPDQITSFASHITAFSLAGIKHYEEG